MIYSEETPHKRWPKPYCFTFEQRDVESLVEYPGILKHEVTDWLTQNIGKEGQTWICPTYSNQDHGWVKIKFSNKDHAMWFRLVWGPT